MIKVHFLIEGDTEEKFVHRVLRSHLSAFGINPHPQGLGEDGRPIGVVEYPRVRKDILITLRQNDTSFCTTMFDYYAMPNSWPGRATAAGDPTVIEEAILADISAAMGEDFNRTRFIPYVQMHEFEALLFSTPGVLADGLGLSDESPIRCILSECHSPEEINDDQETAPSKRIACLYPGYQKVIDGILIAQEIGLNVMRAQCPHFNAWIAKLEGLAGNNRKVE